MITYLPQAVYDPVATKRVHPLALAISTGYFAIDSIDYGYDEFLFTVLHEAGHNVDAARTGTRLARYAGEAAADAYAVRVFAELGRHWGG